MAKAQSEAQWQDIDVDSLDESLKTPYELYKEAQREAAKLRAAFEQDMNDAAGLPEGKKLVFGYRFGKLSAAIVDDTSKPKVRPNGKLSLGEYLKAQQLQG